MAARDLLTRWFVGAPSPAPEPPPDPQPIMRQTAAELARMSDAAEALRSVLVAQERERGDIMRLLGELPTPLAALPRIAAQQDRFSEMAAEALVHAKQRDATIGATLTRLTEGLSQQTEVAGLIQQQLDLNLQAVNGVAEGTKRLTKAVHELAQSSREGTELLARFVRQAQAGAEAQSKSERSLRGWMIALLCASGVLAIVALILGWLALSTRG